MHTYYALVVTFAASTVFTPDPYRSTRAYQRTHRTRQGEPQLSNERTQEKPRHLPRLSHVCLFFSSTAHGSAARFHFRPEKS